MANFYPSLEEIDNLRVQPEEGELYVLNWFNSQLDDSYDVFFQPYLNGDRPDIVVAKRNCGCLVIEVKDWNLSLYEYHSREKLRLIPEDVLRKSPIIQVEKYKTNLFKIHSFELALKYAIDIKSFGLVRTAIFFFKASTQQARKVSFGSSNISENDPFVFGIDCIQHPQGLLDLLNYSHLNRYSSFFSQINYDKFIMDFKPPISNPDIQSTPNLDKHQLKILNGGTKRRKIKGIAGCGKTYLMAHQAVKYFKETNVKVLILTFNITLKNYIRDNISLVLQSRVKNEDFEIINFHNFIRINCDKYDIQITKDTYDDIDLFNGFETEKFQTILIDEVQDFKEEWLQIIFKYFASDDTNIVVYGDEKQNIYGLKMGEDKFPTIPTILGKYNFLKTSHRLNNLFEDMAYDFQKEYLAEKYMIDDREEKIKKNRELGLDLYFSYSRGGSLRDIIEMIKDMIDNKGVHPNDITIISGERKKLGIIRELFEKETNRLTMSTILKNSERISLNEDEEKIKQLERVLKYGFQANSGLLKLTTIHSFKGWQTEILILSIPSYDYQNSMESNETNFNINELVYTAITRVKRHLIIVDRDGRYESFFKKYIK